MYHNHLKFADVPLLLYSRTVLVSRYSLLPLWRIRAARMQHDTPAIGIKTPMPSNRAAVAVAALPLDGIPT